MRPGDSGARFLIGLLPLIAAACALSTAAPTAVSTVPPAHIQATLPFTPAGLQGTVYYVAPTGNDSNPGTLEQPWRTIQKAADTLVAGETVYIRAGVYEERVMPQNSGSAGQPITYAAYPGETATIDGSSITLPDDLAGLFEIVGRSHIRISGLRLINAGPFANNAAILVSDSDHITIENCATLHTASSGIGVWGSQQVVIEGNTVEQAGTGGGQECITVAGTGGFEVRNNTVLDCQKEGIDAKDGSSNGVIAGNVVGRPRAVGIYVDAWDKPTHDITISQNIVFDSVESTGFALASEMGGLLMNVRLENNVAYHNHTYGIEISRCCSDSRPMDGVVIINNTLYENGNGVDWGGGIIADNAQAQHVVIRNNIVSQNLTFQIAVAADVPAGNVTVDHNLIDGYRGYEDEVYGEDYVEGDPRFADPAHGDLHLQSDSPAVDAGSAAEAPAVDLDGDPRPIGAGYDIGADECVQALKNRPTSKVKIAVCFILCSPYHLKMKIPFGGRHSFIRGRNSMMVFARRRPSTNGGTNKRTSAGIRSFVVVFVNGTLHCAVPPGSAWSSRP